MTILNNTYRAVVTLPSKTGIVADEFQNSFIFTRTEAAGAADATAFANLTTDLKNHYTAIPSGAAVAWTSFLAPCLDTGTNKCRVEFYALPTEPGSSGPPESINMWTLGTTSANGLPSEMALCVTLLGFGYDTVPEFAGSTRPRARRRGRLYIGPLASSCMSQDTTTKRITVDSTVRTTATKAVKALGSAAAGHGWTLVVLSRTAWEIQPVVEAQADDAFDVQRRRGEAPTIRTKEVF